METIRRLRLLHQFDVFQADRCTAAHGLELRVPFLDQDFVDGVIKTDPELKMTIKEKDIHRKAFVGYLPDTILNRPKDAFSDAVGYGWADYISQAPRDPSLLQKVTHNPLLTPEEAWYRKTFWDLYGKENDHLITEIWRPKWTNETDPSARKLKF